MDKPDFFIDNLTPWDTWCATRQTLGATNLLCATASVGIHRDKAVVEKQHPGFISAYETLAKLGCDFYFATSVLKFCIINAPGRLDDFLITSELPMMIPTARTLCLSGEEFVATLDVTAKDAGHASMPEDLSFSAKM